MLGNPVGLERNGVDCCRDGVRMRWSQGLISVGAKVAKGRGKDKKKGVETDQVRKRKKADRPESKRKRIKRSSLVSPAAIFLTCLIKSSPGGHDLEAEGCEGGMLFSFPSGYLYEQNFQPVTVSSHGRNDTSPHNFYPLGSDTGRR